MKVFVSYKLNLKESSSIIVKFFSYDYDVSDYQFLFKSALPIEDI